MSEQINTFAFRRRGWCCQAGAGCCCRQLDFHFFLLSAMPNQPPPTQIICQGSCFMAEGCVCVSPFCESVGLGVAFFLRLVMCECKCGCGSGAKPAPWPTFAATFSICFVAECEMELVRRLISSLLTMRYPVIGRKFQNSRTTFQTNILKKNTPLELLT